jgi:hypothetical protein
LPIRGKLSFADNPRQRRGGKEIMKKKAILFFLVAFAMVAGTVYAGSYMVVVFDVESGGVDNVYDATNKGIVADGKITFNGEVAAGDNVTGKDFTVNKKGSKKVSRIKDKGIPDYTVILSNASPGCITYTYRGYSWTVCTP